MRREKRKKKKIIQHICSNFKIDVVKYGVKKCGQNNFHAFIILLSSISTANENVKLVVDGLYNIHSTYIYVFAQILHIISDSEAPLYIYYFTPVVFFFF